MRNKRAIQAVNDYIFKDGADPETLLQDRKNNPKLS